MSELDGSEYREASAEAPSEAGAESHRESVAEAGESGPAEAGQSRPAEAGESRPAEAGEGGQAEASSGAGLEAPDDRQSGGADSGASGAEPPSEAEDGPDTARAEQEPSGHEEAGHEQAGHEPGTSEPAESGPTGDRLQGDDAADHSAENAGSGAAEQADPAGPEADPAKLASPDAEPESEARAGDPGEAGPAEAEPTDAPPAETAPREAEPAESGPTEPGFDEPAEAGAGHQGEVQPVREADGERSDRRAGTSDTRDGEVVPGESEPAETAEDVPKGMAGRPDVSRAYPDVFTEQDSSGLAVDRPHKSPETWINDVNPGNGSNNCGECARAVQATWSGDPSVAATLTDRTAFGEPDACMGQWAGQESQPASMQQVGERLEALGPGSSAVVGFDRQDQAGHWFNAINDGGVIKAVDGQSGKVEPWPPSVAGLGFDESEMRVSDAIFFDPDGVMIR